MKTMSYESYLLIGSLIEESQQKLESQFHIACSFIPSGKSNKTAYEIFVARSANLRAAKEQLHAVVASSYKDHPNAEMRKFWGWP